MATKDRSEKEMIKEIERLSKKADRRSQTGYATSPPQPCRGQSSGGILSAFFRLFSGQ
jgi:hypothetical protein